MKTKDLKNVFNSIYDEINKNKNKLIELDQTFGDGDLGISMENGFKGISILLEDFKEDDFGKYFLKISKTFNESAPSSLGTIISFVFMGIAKSLKGKTHVSFDDLKNSLLNGVELMVAKTDAKLKDKTILDSLKPAVDAFCKEDNIKDAINKAYLASEKGMLDTKNYIAVHGRAAYHKDKTLGHIDGGAYVSYLIFKAIANV